MIKLKDYVGNQVVIYEDTPMFQNGGVAIVIDYDTISHGEPTFLVSELQSSYLPPTELMVDDIRYSSSRSDSEKWVALSNIKEVIVFTRPKRNKFVQKLINLTRELWIRGSKILS